MLSFLSWSVNQHWSNLRFGILMGIVLFTIATVGDNLPARASEPIETGYRDFSYGSGCNSTPTGEKPESKLWFNDGSWWGSLCNSTMQEYHIYHFDVATQSWTDTGTVLDDRPGSKADTLWDETNQKLYVASHLFTTSANPESSASQWGRLYRYSYAMGTKTYSLDTGFPVNVTKGKSETLVLAKDSTDRLWVTYVESGKVMINHSTSDDQTWGEPFVLPVNPGSINVTSDDISSIVSFQGNKIGVMWSHQIDNKFYFAVHVDGDADNVWQLEQSGIPGPPCSGDCGDDHINLKSTQTDETGRVFAAIKTSLDASNAPLIMLLVRNLNGNWDSHVFGRKQDHHTRPIVLLDEENGQLYMFATSEESGGSIYYKATDINSINFPEGKGELFISSSDDSNINNATSTKQNLNGATDLMVVASSRDSRYYFHNYIDLPSNDPPVADFSGLPTTGDAPLTVAFSDLSSGNPTSWSWDFGDSNNSTVQHPSHTYTNPGVYTVSLIIGNDTGTDSQAKIDYVTVTTPTVRFSLVVNVVGSGSVALDPPDGPYEPGTVVTLAANPDPSFEFSGWSDDLSSHESLETVIMDTDKYITATFVEQNSSGSPTRIVYLPIVLK